MLQFESIYCDIHMGVYKTLPLRAVKKKRENKKFISQKKEERKQKVVIYGHVK